MYDWNFIFGSASYEGRAARHRSNCTPEEAAAGAGHMGFVAILEIIPYQYEELDAETAEHAIELARDAVKRGAAMTASARSVHADGSLHKHLAIIGSDYEDGEVAA